MINPALSPLLNALKRGDIVITPTNRLQRELLWLYSRSNHSPVSIKPHCYSYEAFLQHWLSELEFITPEAPLLLNNWQFYLLWKRITTQLSTRVTNHFEIKQAIAAYKNCALAQAAPSGSDFLYTPSAETFQKIAQAVEHELQANNWLAPAKLADYLSEKKFLIAAKNIYWAFFDNFHPQQSNLQTKLAQQNILQHYFDYSDKQSEHKVLVAENETAELEQLIQWIKTQQAAGKQRIGVVVPDLSQNASFLQKMLRLHLNSADLRFSLGQPLFNYPMIKHALAMLKLNCGQNISNETCKILLLSPFIKAATARKKLLQDNVFQEPLIPYDVFLQLSQDYFPKLEQLPETASPSNWVNLIAKRLATFGFPGPNPLTDESQQVLAKFYTIIEEFNLAALITEQISKEEMIKLLTQACQEQIHQPPQNYQGIHIMGWLESSGFCGDALWICHFQSNLVPENTALSPLLPINWQKKHQLAKTQRDKEFAIAQSMLHRFINAHQEHEIVISYAKSINQEPQWPSPLLPNWPPFIQTAISHASYECENIDQPTNIALTNDVKGGYQILASQAKCPFQAFANYRLFTKPSITEDIGFNPSERGRIIHRTLQHIWEQLQNHHNLKTTDEETLKKICLQCIDKTLLEFQPDRPYSLDTLLFSLERQQVLNIILPCLEFDKNRQDFTIAGLEENIALEIDGWQFNLRYDRLDQLTNGDLLIIDYKSKLPSPLPWQDERPIHPQILLYALANIDIKHLLFVALNHKEFSHTGFGNAEIGIANLKQPKKTWLEQQQTWLKTITELITEFRAGACTPTPKNTAICTHCHNRDICRQTTDDS